MQRIHPKKGGTSITVLFSTDRVLMNRLTDVTNNFPCHHRRNIPATIYSGSCKLADVFDVIMWEHKKLHFIINNILSSTAEQPSLLSGPNHRPSPLELGNFNRFVNYSGALVGRSLWGYLIAFSLTADGGVSSTNWEWNGPTNCRLFRTFCSKTYKC